MSDFRDNLKFQQFARIFWYVVALLRALCIIMWKGPNRKRWVLIMVLREAISKAWQEYRRKKK